MLHDRWDVQVAGNYMVREVGLVRIGELCFS